MSAVERAIVVGLIRSGQNREQVNEYLDELELLADTAGAEVLERVIQQRYKIDSATLMGRGKAAELASLVKILDADLIIFDDDLSPAQAKNIESLCGVKIVDRSGLILDIFARNARTREARIQVELAQLKYLVPRLTRRWTHLSRQVGGIGVRGPGEMQLEVDRRAVRKRIATLEYHLAKIANQRTIRRKGRAELVKAALVGYTNVGKSTLLNALTHADAFVENRLFATLDPTIRNLTLSDHQRILLVDTVGFIRKLPHHLIASFKSTLEEAADTDLLLHVIDSAHPHYRDQMETVESVLKELGLDQKPVIKVFNKIDLIPDPAILSELRMREGPCVCVSAQRGIFLNELKEAIRQYAESKSTSLQIVLTPDRFGLIGRLCDLADITRISYENSKAIIDLRATPVNAERIRGLCHAHPGH